MIFLLSIHHLIKLFTEKSVVRIWSLSFDHQKHIISLNLNAPEYWGLQLQFPVSGKLNTCHLPLQADPSWLPHVEPRTSGSRSSVFICQPSLVIICHYFWKIVCESEVHSFHLWHTLNEGDINSCCMLSLVSVPIHPSEDTAQRRVPVSCWFMDGGDNVSHQVTERTHSCSRC